MTQKHKAQSVDSAANDKQIFNHIKGLLAVALLSFLTACNLTGASTEVSFPNPFGLNQQSLALKRSGDTTSVTWTGGFTGLPIVDETGTTTKIPEFYSGLTPGRLLERLGFEVEMVATSKTGKAADFPDEFTVSAPKLLVEIVDGDGVTSVRSNLTSKGTLEVTYKDKKCTETATETTCIYKTTQSDAVLDLEYGGADFRKFFNEILTAGESPNLLSASFSVTLTGTGGRLLGFPPSDTEARLVLKSSDGKLVF
jgi:hypothetical protein